MNLTKRQHRVKGITKSTSLTHSWKGGWVCTKCKKIKFRLLYGTRCILK